MYFKAAFPDEKHLCGCPQVGKDAAATRFLSALDTDPVIGSMIDCTSYYEQEQEEYARKVRLFRQSLICHSVVQS